MYDLGYNPEVLGRNRLSGIQQVRSYALSSSLEVDFILIREHGVSLYAQAVIHSDQGCHYTSCKFIELVECNGKLYIENGQSDKPCPAVKLYLGGRPSAPVKKERQEAT